MVEVSGLSDSLHIGLVGGHEHDTTSVNLLSFNKVADEVESCLGLVPIELEPDIVGKGRESVQLMKIGSKVPAAAALNGSFSC